MNLEQISNHLFIFNFDMKKFLINILLIISIPFIIIFSLYWLTDPFKVNKQFSLNNFTDVNREYISMGLFLKQNPIYHYNSFVFGSSRCHGINTYTWKHLLNKTTNQKDTISQFLFQAWSETINGINQKIEYLDRNNIPLNNALVLVDIGSFRKDAEDVLSVKHYLLSEKSKISYQKVFVQAYMGNPGKIASSIKRLIKPKPVYIGFDTISNDGNINNRYNYLEEPKQNSLDKSQFGKRPLKEQFAEQEITSDYLKILENIKRIFDKHQTQYKFIITPTYNQVRINDEDLKLLNQVFGEDNVYNFSGKNYITEDKYNWTDNWHFDLIVGWWMLHTIYEKNRNLP